MAAGEAEGEQAERLIKSSRGKEPRLFVLPHEWEFALEEGGLNRICILAGAGDFGGLPTSECDFVNEVFAPGGAAGFPSHEDVSGDETADGRS